MKFKLILADPPWDYETRTIIGRTRHPEKHYKIMSPLDIAKLPVESIADKDSILMLWITWPHLIPYGQLVMEGWGFKYVSGFPWLKLSRHMLPRMGTGFHSRAVSEVMLIGKRGTARAPKAQELLEGVLFNSEEEKANCENLTGFSLTDIICRLVQDLNEGSLISKQGKHSAKPDEIYDRCELYEGPYIELFARPDGGLDIQREHWTYVGNEITGRSIEEDISDLVLDKELPCIVPTGVSDQENSELGLIARPHYHGSANKKSKKEKPVKRVYKQLEMFSNEISDLKCCQEKLQEELITNNDLDDLIEELRLENLE